MKINELFILFYSIRFDLGGGRLPDTSHITIKHGKYIYIHFVLTSLNEMKVFLFTRWPDNVLFKRMVHMLMRKTENIPFGNNMAENRCFFLLVCSFFAQPYLLSTVKGIHMYQVLVNVVVLVANWHHMLLKIASCNGVRTGIALPSKMGMRRATVSRREGRGGGQVLENKFRKKLFIVIFRRGKSGEMLL